MNKYVALIVITTSLGAVLLYSRIVLKSLFNPPTIYTVVWTSLYIFYIMNFIPYVKVDGLTWLVLGISNILFIIGAYCITIPFLKKNYYKADFGLPNIDLFRLKVIIIILYILGLIIFSFYMRDVLQKFSLRVVLTEPWNLRWAISDREISWALKYFYFTTPSAVLSFIYMLVLKKKPIFMLIIFISSILIGVATTGRTALIWTLIWVISLYLYYPIHSRLTKLKLVCILLGVMLVYFFIIGNWMGKSFQNSGIKYSTKLQGSISFFAIPYLYFTGNIPAFHNMIHEPATLSYGSYTFLPIVKIIPGLFGDFIPSEIEGFTSIPYPFNTYTYLSPYYHDFGLPGVFLFSWLLGILLMYFYMKMIYIRYNLASLYFNSLMASVVIFSFGSNRLISAPTWFFIFIGLIVGKFIKRAPKHVSPLNIPFNYINKRP